MVVPENPKIFHIVHVDHLASIINDGGLFSDTIVSSRTDNYGTSIAMNHIKAGRRKKVIGGTSKGTVGEHVPFYFRPRSMMLYIIYKGNHLDTTYRDGQKHVVHLVSDMDRAIEWAEAHGKDWVFSDRNASAGFAQFYANKKDLKELRWDLIPLRDFQTQQVREAMQSEFLVGDNFDWELITGIAVYDETTKRKVEAILENVKHKPIVKVVKEWYY